MVPRKEANIGIVALVCVLFAVSAVLALWILMDKQNNRVNTEVNKNTAIDESDKAQSKEEVNQAVINTNTNNEVKQDKNSELSEKEANQAVINTNTNNGAKQDKNSGLSEKESNQAVINTNANNGVKQDKNSELTEEEIEEIKKASAEELANVFKDVAGENLEKCNFTTSEIAEIKRRVRPIVIKYVKDLKQIDGDLSSDFEIGVNEVSDSIVDSTILYIKNSIETKKAAQNAVKLGTIADMKNVILLRYSAYIAAHGVTGTVTITKEDYISALKENGFSDEEIALLNFTLDENGAPVYK